MKILFLSLIMLLTLGCSNDADDKNYNATVIGVGLDCGNSYLIKFNENAIGVPTNTSENIFYEINLPSQFKVNGLKINVAFRQPTNNEIMVCTAQDYAFPQIFIESVN
jgi:hypothetical protein